MGFVVRRCVLCWQASDVFCIYERPYLGENGGKQEIVDTDHGSSLIHHIVVSEFGAVTIMDAAQGPQNVPVPKMPLRLFCLIAAFSRLWAARSS